MRIIARLDIKGSRLIKGVRFEGVRVVGDPNQYAKNYASTNIDEILYIDTVASLYGRNGLTGLLRHASKDVFVPITAGGGIRSANDARNLLQAGADKIAVNTGALKNHSLISELADQFGKQCVVVSIQAKRSSDGRCWEAMCDQGRERTGIDVQEWIERVQKLGAGEILLTSVDQDGTCKGPDLDLIQLTHNCVDVPLVFGGGISRLEDIDRILDISMPSGISIGSGFHFKKISPSEISSHIKSSQNIPQRKCLSSSEINSIPKLNNKSIAIVDYKMGNTQSLINAFGFLEASTVITNNQDELSKADLIVLPGVGSFHNGMEQLNKLNLTDFIYNQSHKYKPIIGICLGMQLLFEIGTEFGITKGLGIFKGEVTSLPNKDIDGAKIYLPHIGWNQVKASSPRVSELGDSFYQYFVHSFAAQNAREEDVLYSSEYRMQKFTSAVYTRKTMGFQFHPERSGFRGLKLLSLSCLKLTS